MNKYTDTTSDAEANWGNHSTGGIDDKNRQPWQKLKRRFGFSLHLIAYTHYAIPAASDITPASPSEPAELTWIIDKRPEESPAAG